MEVVATFPFHGMASHYHSARLIPCPPFYSINRERIGAVKALCPTDLSAVNGKNHRLFQMMLKGNAGEGG